MSRLLVVVVLVLVGLLSFGRQPQVAQAAGFFVTPSVVEAGQPLTFDIAMAGLEGPDGIWVEGTEQAYAILIKPDLTSATPGGCFATLRFPGGAYEYWAQDWLVTGPGTAADGWTWGAPAPGTGCGESNGLSPGDYIASLVYYRANGDGSITLQPPIDKKITVLNPVKVTATSDNFITGGSVQISIDIAGAGEAGTWSATAQSVSVFGPCSGTMTFPDGATAWGTDRTVTFPSPDLLSNCGNIGTPGEYVVQVSYRYRFPDGSVGLEKFLTTSFKIPPILFNVISPAVHTSGRASIAGADIIAAGQYGEKFTSMSVTCPDGTVDQLTADSLDVLNNAAGTSYFRLWPSTSFEGPCDLFESGDYTVAVATLHNAFSSKFNFYNPDDTTDTDGDGVPNVRDNCDDIDNPGQEDFILDGQGDLCDDDDDNDGVPDSADNCPRFISPSGEVSPSQNNFDGDSMGDLCDPDDDADGLSDEEERAAGTDPFSVTPYDPGVNPYAGGAPTGTSNPATAGESVGVVISPPDNVDSVGVVVTDPNGQAVYEDTLTPQSPVAFSFVPNVPGAWTISADYFTDKTKVDSVSHVLMVTSAAGTPTPTPTATATPVPSPSATVTATATATAAPTNTGSVSEVLRVVTVAATPTPNPAATPTSPASATAAPSPASPPSLTPGATVPPTVAAITPITTPRPPATGLGSAQPQSPFPWFGVAAALVALSGGVVLAGQRTRG